MANEKKVATRNTRIMWSPGATQYLKKVLQKYDVDIIAFQEIPWTGKGEIKDAFMFTKVSFKTARNSIIAKFLFLNCYLNEFS